MKKIMIDAVTRIEGHAKISIQLDDSGQVASTQLHITQVRGFEKFTEGRPYYEMPSITARICGICPVSHLLASSKACDAIMSVRIPETAAMLREVLHCGQFVQSHALSFFHLSSPDLLLGFDSDPARRNVLGVLEKFPDIARDGIALRKFGQEVISGLAKERIHPSWTVPGGVNAPLATRRPRQDSCRLARGQGHRPAHAEVFQRSAGSVQGGDRKLWQRPQHVCGPGGCGRETPTLRRRHPVQGRRGQDRCGPRCAPRDYQKFIGEATLSNSYLKAPYYKPLGFPDGVYRVGPLGRLNVAKSCGTPLADVEFTEFHQRLGKIVPSSFHFHYARLIEALYGLERMEALLNDPAVLGKQIRAHAGVNNLEGVGMIEAPRGILIHHYKVNEEGAITWANLIVATGHNNLAINRSIDQVARHFIDGKHLKEGMLNRVSAIVRAYDPCFSCSTHASGQIPMHIQLLGPEGSLLDELRS